jgi:uncharacterized membrane protein HdeD (DUF308 family)
LCAVGRCSRGAARSALPFGLVVFLWPHMMLSALALTFGVYALLDGSVTISLGTRPGATEHSWVVLLEGLAGVGLALAIFLWARVTVVLVDPLIALWAITTGLLELIAASRSRRQVTTEPLLVVAGAASVLLGFAIFLWRPAVGPFALVVLLGSYALVFGVAMLPQGFRLRKALARLNGTTWKPDRRPVRGHLVPRTGALRVQLP